LRYVGQASELTIPLPGACLAAAGLPDLADAFRREYSATYGDDPEEPLELVNLRLVATGVRPQRLDFHAVRATAGQVGGGRSSRAVSFARGAPSLETPIWPRDAVPPDAVAGPLIVESYDSTVVVPPGAAVRRDGLGNLVIALR
jgi:N-methylhydantoinase A